MKDVDFEADCRSKFLRFCQRYAEAKYHADKRHYLEKAYLVIDAYLDWRDVQSL